MYFPCQISTARWGSGRHVFDHLKDIVEVDTYWGAKLSCKFSISLPVIVLGLYMVLLVIPC